MSKEVENALGEAGFAISDTPPTANEQPTQEAAPAPVQESAPVEPAADVPQEQAVSPESQPQAPTQETEQPPQQPVEVVDFNSQRQPQQSGVSDEDMLRYLSERLGSEVNDFDSISKALSTPAEIDERVAAINEFVRTTGRGPEDWYRYQQLNPSEMDDVTAVRNQLVLDNSNLTPDEVNLLMNSKYKLNDDLATDDELALAKLNLKMDAENARQSLTNYREKYAAPEVQNSADVSSPITEDWVRAMKSEVDQFNGLVFDLPNGDFTFGIKNEYRETLADKNSRLEEFFDDYVYDDGSWNYEKLNAHRALIDNVDDIVNAVYRQGISDGQRRVVSSAANVQPTGNQVSRQPSNNPVADQLRQAMGGRSPLTFNI